ATSGMSSSGKVWCSKWSPIIGRYLSAINWRTVLRARISSSVNTASRSVRRSRAIGSIVARALLGKGWATLTVLFYAVRRQTSLLPFVGWPSIMAPSRDRRASSYLRGRGRRHGVASDWREEQITIAGLQVQLLHGGQ